MCSYPQYVFEGDFSCLSGYSEYGAKFDTMIQQEFAIFLLNTVCITSWEIIGINLLSRVKEVYRMKLMTKEIEKPCLNPIGSKDDKVRTLML